MNTAISLWLRSDAKHDLNVRSAYVHMVGDAISAVGVVAAGVVIAVTGMSSYLSRHTFGQMWYWQATHKDEASIIPPDKYPLLHQTALNACDANDGLKDGLISTPESCNFDSVVVQCKDAAGTNCRTAAQLTSKLY